MGFHSLLVTEQNRGTVIDHIYIKYLPKMYTCTEIVFDVSDTCYSDHDKVYCTFKFKIDLL